MAAKGGISTSAGRGKPVDLRMAQYDKYINDPNMELVRTASGKFQFRERKAAAAPKAKPKPKTASANLVPGGGGKSRTGGGSIPTPKRNPRPLSAFTGRKPRGLDTPTAVTPPSVSSRDDYSSPRAKRNMQIAEGALMLSPLGRGMSMGRGAASVAPGLSKYTRALEANRAGNITTREAMEQMGMKVPGIPRGRGASKASKAPAMSRGAKNAKSAQEALRRRDVTVDEASDMAMGFRRGGAVKKKAAARGRMAKPARKR